ncbi:MAG: SGNH/GDSL hydrolase family protein [Bacteroidales bacterium]|nr:SGNH/GDSL hydrolase family protein [Bacteroidales bacterium]
MDPKLRKILTFAVRYIIFLFIFLLIDFCISEFLSSGLIKYYGLDKPSKVLLIGHSHTMLGLDKTLIEEEMHCNVSKYAMEGANVADRLAMIKHFLHQNGDSVKIITYDVDATFLTGMGLSINSYKLFYPFMDDPYIREYVKSEAKPEYDYYIKKWIRTSRFTDLNLNGSLRGHMRFYTNIKIGSIDTVAYKQRIAENDFVKITFDRNLQEEFEETLQLISERNVKMFLVLIPTIGILNRADPEKYSEAIKMIENYSKKYPNIYFINYNDEFEDQYDLFYDEIHLNPKGNKTITDKLVEDIKRILL